MTRITNTILSASIPNPQYKKYLNGRLTLTLIIPSHRSHCVSWNYNPLCALVDLVSFVVRTHTLKHYRAADFQLCDKQQHRDILRCVFKVMEYHGF